MGQDMVKGRRTEIEFLNGFVVNKGKEVGISTPAAASAAIRCSMVPTRADPGA